MSRGSAGAGRACHHEFRSNTARGRVGVRQGAL